MKYNKENCSSLAAVIVENWDIDSLLGFAHKHLTRVYLEHEDLFHEDYEDEFGYKEEESLKRVVDEIDEDEFGYKEVDNLIRHETMDEDEKI